MTTRISQILAVVGGVTTDTKAQLAAIEQTVANEAVLNGFDRRYRPLKDPREGGVELPGEQKLVQATAEDALNQVAKLLTRQFDVTRTLDEAKTKASAPVRVDGTEILPAVTTDHLIYLEGELSKLHALVSKLPTLDTATHWSEEGVEPGQHKSDPVQTTSSKPAYYNHILSEATEKWPANVQVMQRDEVQGYRTLTSFSGALYPQRKRQLLDRLQQLREAVKFAREEANTADAPEVKEGKRIFDWWLRP